MSTAPVRTALDATDGASRKKVLSWALWDWGTQPFGTVVITFVFSVYITSAAFGDPTENSKALAWSNSIAGILIALLAPVLGQNADRSGRKVRTMKWLTWAVAVICFLLWFVKPEPRYLWLGLGLMALGSVLSEIAGVNYNALLDDVATGRNVGRVSGFGWGLGYLGGIVSLLLVYFLLIQPTVGLFGVSNEGGTDIRAAAIVCGVWTLLFTIPTFLNLSDRPVAARTERVGVVESYRLLFASVRRLWRTSRQTVFFLLASALFRDGLAGVFAFGAPLAAVTFGFSAGEVILFGAAANVVAGLSTMAFGLLDDRLGPKKVIMISLVSLVALGIAIFVLHNGGKGVFWATGLMMSAFVGPAQSASRSFLARLIPEGKAGEVFGLYATTGRVVSFMAPAAFGIAITLGERFTTGNAQYWGILGIVLVLLLGLLVLIPVHEHDRHQIS